nr:PREDICTED: uncharacterized protein LOC106705684 [Latimeria chalumnae]|eukprot:XP_014351029.1 PREDICTED: uncharacterized protein LOC106705684 [Latimeria chalumnae]
MRSKKTLPEGNSWELVRRRKRKQKKKLIESLVVYMEEILASDVPSSQESVPVVNRFQALETDSEVEEVAETPLSWGDLSVDDSLDQEDMDFLTASQVEGIQVESVRGAVELSSDNSGLPPGQVMLVETGETSQAETEKEMLLTALQQQEDEMDTGIQQEQTDLLAGQPGETSGASTSAEQNAGKEGSGKEEGNVNVGTWALHQQRGLVGFFLGTQCTGQLQERGRRQSQRDATCTDATARNFTVHLILSLRGPPARARKCLVLGVDLTVQQAADLAQSEEPPELGQCPDQKDVAFHNILQTEGLQCWAKEVRVSYEAFLHAD